MAEGHARRPGAGDQEHRHRGRTLAAAGEDSLLRSCGGRDQGRDCGLQEQAGEGKGRPCYCGTRSAECLTTDSQGPNSRETRGWSSDSIWELEVGSWKLT